MDAALIYQLTDADVTTASRGAVNLRGLLDDLAATDQTLTITAGGHTYVFTIEELGSLAKVAEIVAESRGEEDMEISPNDAAAILGMSRPTVIRMIEKGDIGARMVNTHHRLSRKEVVAYRDKQAQERRQALQNLADFSEKYDF